MQKAIGIVRELMKEAPEQKEKCEQLMSLLTSRELLQPTFLSDNTLAQDHEMRDWLGVAPSRASRLSGSAGARGA